MHFTVSQSQLARYNRLDPAFAHVVHEHQERADALANLYSPEQAQQRVASFPADLVQTACPQLASGSGKPFNSDIAKAAQTYPFLALALIEQALPAYQQQQQQALESLSQQQASLLTLAGDTFPTPSNRRKLRPA